MPEDTLSAERFSSETITEQDIVFDCPACRKSLVIDERAGGLRVPCPECKKEIEVPAPAHMTAHLEHHGASTTAEKLEMLERRITENRMQKTEATNKMHDHMTQVNRLKARLQRLEKEFQAMEAEKKKLAG